MNAHRIVIERVLRAARHSVNEPANHAAIDEMQDERGAGDLRRYGRSK